MGPRMERESLDTVPLVRTNVAARNTDRPNEKDTDFVREGESDSATTRLARIPTRALPSVNSIF